MDRQAFRELALTEIDAVFRMAFHLARNADEAEELLQETYLRALRAGGSFELRDRGIRPWLFKILHNAFYTRIAKKKNAPVQFDDLGAEAQASAPGTDPAAPPPAWDLASFNWEHVDDRLKNAIEELPLHYREVLLLWAVEGLKYRQIAEVLDVPLGTVMSRLYRARDLLTAQLADLAADRGITVPDEDR